MNHDHRMFILNNAPGIEYIYVEHARGTEHSSVSLTLSCFITRAYCFKFKKSECSVCKKSRLDIDCILPTEREPVFNSKFLVRVRFKIRNSDESPCFEQLET